MYHSLLYSSLVTRSIKMATEVAILVIGLQGQPAPELRFLRPPLQSLHH